MSQLKQFVKDAIKTESRINQVEVNEKLLTQTISILIHAGNILDQIKKQVFYNKPYNIDSLIEHTEEINISLTNLNNLDINQIADDKTKLEINPRLFHAIVGISTESTELLESFAANEKLDKVNIAEELGDLDWYKAIAVDELNIEWKTILDTVIEKLKIRYPNKFSRDAAVSRDLVKEREILDKRLTSPK